MKEKVVQDSSVSKVTENESNKTREGIQTKNKNKTKKEKPHLIRLYKCRTCDVHYTTQQLCFNHIHQHVPLDPSKYTHCKECNMKFTVKAFEKHNKMVHFHDFELRNVVIEEHTPNTRKIATYYASERAHRVETEATGTGVQARDASTVLLDKGATATEPSKDIPISPGLKENVSIHIPLEEIVSSVCKKALTSSAVRVTLPEVMVKDNANKNHVIKPDVSNSEKNANSSSILNDKDSKADHLAANERKNILKAHSEEDTDVISVIDTLLHDIENTNNGSRCSEINIETVRQDEHSEGDAILAATKTDKDKELTYIFKSPEKVESDSSKDDSEVTQNRTEDIDDIEGAISALRIRVTPEIDAKVSNDSNISVTEPNLLNTSKADYSVANEDVHSKSVDININKEMTTTDFKASVESGDNNIPENNNDNCELDENAVNNGIKDIEEDGAIHLVDKMIKKELIESEAEGNTVRIDRWLYDHLQHDALKALQFRKEVPNVDEDSLESNVTENLKGDETDDFSEEACVDLTFTGSD